MAGLEYSSGDPPPNPLDPAVKLEQPFNSHVVDNTIHPQQASTAEDSAVTKAEEFERRGIADGVEESLSKRRKLDLEIGTQGPTRSERQKGVAPIKKESVSSMPVCE